MKRIKFFLTKMFGKQQFRAEKGFTLAEIMVTAGIVAVLAVAIMRMNSMAQKTAKTTAQQLEATQVLSRVQQILQDPVSCQETFKNSHPQPTATITRIKRKVTGSATPEDAVGAGAICLTGTLKPGGGSVCTSGSGTSGRVALYKMVLKQTSSPLVVDGGATGELELHMVKGAGTTINWEATPAAQDGKKDIHNLSSYGSITTVKKIPVSLYMQGGAVVSCYTNEQNFLEQACTNLGGNYNDTLSPVCALPIPNDDDAACTQVALTAVGSTSYTGISLGTSNKTCPAGTVLRGITLLTSAAGQTAEVEGTSIQFSNITLSLKCCPYKAAR